MFSVTVLSASAESWELWKWLWETDTRLTTSQSSSMISCRSKKRPSLQTINVNNEIKMFNQKKTDGFLSPRQAQDLPERSHKAEQSQQSAVYQGEPPLHRTVQVNFLHATRIVDAASPLKGQCDILVWKMKRKIEDWKELLIAWRIRRMWSWCNTCFVL